MESVAVHQTRQAMSGKEMTDVVRLEKYRNSGHNCRVYRDWGQCLLGVESEGGERQDNDKTQYKEQG